MKIVFCGTPQFAVPTLKFLLMRLKILVEPSGAVSAAAALFKKLPTGVSRVGIILSGGNMDYEQLGSL